VTKIIERTDGISPERMQEILSTWRYFDADLVFLFRDLPATRNIALNCALYLQYLDKELSSQGRPDDWIEFSNSEMKRKYLGFLTPEQIRKAYRALRKLGIISAKSRIYRKIHPKMIIWWATWARDRKKKGRQ